MGVCFTVVHSMDSRRGNTMWLVCFVQTRVVRLYVLYARIIEMVCYNKTKTPAKISVELKLGQH